MHFMYKKVQKKPFSSIFGEFFHKYHPRDASISFWGNI